MSKILHEKFAVVDTVLLAAAAVWFVSVVLSTLS